MPITTQQHFEQAAEHGEWPSRYDATKVENYNFITRREAVATLLAGNRFDSVLDLGCGSGDNVELLSSVAREYVGVDYSPAMIKRARQIRRGSSSPAEPVFVEGNAESL